MKVWLAKADPKTYSIDDLEQDGEAIWKKVRHPKAMQFMTDMKPKDKILVYHSGQKEIVGLAEVISNAPDPDHPKGRLVNVKFLTKYTEPLVSLKDIKESGKFEDFRLVREPRLSVMDVPESLLIHFKLEA